MSNGEEGIVLGRDEGADVTLDDPAVSRFHARLFYNDDRWRILDLGSSNQTFVNGDPIRESPLEPGDQVGIGDCELHLIDEVARVASTSSKTQVLSSLTANLATDHPESARAAAVLRTLYEISQQLAETRDATALLESSLRSLTTNLGADRGAVLAIEGDALLSRAAHSRHGQALRGFVLSQAIYREIMQSREAVLSEDTSSDTRFQDQQSIVGEEIRSIVAAPIPTGDGIGGILYLDRLQSDDHSSFVAEDLYGAAVAAEMLGVALDVGREIQALEGEREQLVKTIIETHPIIGNSAAIKRVREFISRAAPTESTVLVQGDTGTGKELVARAIHYQSPRAGHPFVAINCAAIPETLVESELFGHEKGAFTGAVGRKLGKFEAGNLGTVFLDEIGELPLSCQSKLLRLLEERRFERVGGTESVEVDVR
ncbi:MAG: sigma 54-interacting transcriptional regulator, partial [Planctomycetota bacterium]